MNESANRPTPEGAGSQPLRWDVPAAAPRSGPYQPGQAGQPGPLSYPPPAGPPRPSAFGAPTHPFAPPPYFQPGHPVPPGGPAGPPPPPYGQFGYGYPQPPRGPLPPNYRPRRRRALPAALAGVLAALVVAVGVLLYGGATGTLPGISSSGSSADGTAASSTAPDYDTGVVDITAILGNEGAVAAGTGMILTADGTILTNNHVVDGASSITATDVNTGKEYAASLVGTDANDDIAVLRLRNASGLTPVSLSTSSSVSVGTKVVAIGNAGGKGGSPSVVTGQVTALGQTITATDSSGGNAETLHGLIQVNAPIVAGDSGGPLTDTSGKVIGINTAASADQAAQNGFGRGFGSGGFGRGGSSSGTGSSSTTEGFAIPIQTALSVAKQIEAGKSDSSSSSSTASGHGYLGVSVSDDNTSDVSGAVVGGTVVGSPAASAGITSGDVIVGLNGSRVSSASDLSQLVDATSPGQQASVSWVDSSGQTHTATVTLMSASG